MYLFMGVGVRARMQMYSLTHIMQTNIYIYMLSYIQNTSPETQGLYEQLSPIRLPVKQILEFKV